MWMRSPACSRIASTTVSAVWPTASAPIPPARSTKTLPSTSSTSAPWARRTPMEWAWASPAVTAAVLRACRARLRGPGTSVRSLMWVMERILRPDPGRRHHGEYGRRARCAFGKRGGVGGGMPRDGCLAEGAVFVEYEVDRVLRLVAHPDLVVQ